MAHTKLIEHSTAMSAAVGDAYAALQNVRAVGGLPAPASVGLGTLEGALARVAERNAAMGEIAHGLADDAPPADAGGGKTDGVGKVAKPVV